MSVWLTATKTTNDVLKGISTASGTVSQGLNSLSSLASAGAAHAEAYRQETEEKLALDAKKRKNRLIARLSREDAEFYKELYADLRQDPELLAYFEQSLQEYAEVDPKVTAQLAERTQQALPAAE